MKEIKVKVNIDAKQIIKKLTQTKKEIKEIGISFIEMLGELKDDNTKVFKDINERGKEYSHLYSRYIVKDDYIYKVSLKNKRDLEVVTFPVGNIIRVTSRFIEVKQYCDVIKSGEEYFYIDKNLEIKKNIYLRNGEESEKAKDSKNMFKEYSEAEESLKEFKDILRVN